LGFPGGVLFCPAVRRDRCVGACVWVRHPSGWGLGRRAVGLVRSPQGLEQSGQAASECRKMDRPLGRDRALQGSPA
jgi:hypothetical protein